MTHEEFRDSIEACYKCATDCLQCANSCLDEHDVNDMRYAMIARMNVKSIQSIWITAASVPNRAGDALKRAGQMSKSTL
jgi:hypothetical protein